VCEYTGGGCCRLFFGAPRERLCQVAEAPVRLVTHGYGRQQGLLALRQVKGTPEQGGDAAGAEQVDEMVPQLPAGSIDCGSRGGRIIRPTGFLLDDPSSQFNELGRRLYHVGSSRVRYGVGVRVFAPRK
jgi:hypothetical protein